MSKQTKESMPGKEERLALAKKEGKSELEIYLGLCKKFHREPAKSAVKRAKAVSGSRAAATAR